MEKILILDFICYRYTVTLFKNQINIKLLGYLISTSWKKFGTANKSIKYRVEIRGN